MKCGYKILWLIIFGWSASGCHSTKKLQTAINKKDAPVKNITVKSGDSVHISGVNTEAALSLLKSFKKSRIDFRTFYAKAKVQYEDGNGKQPDFNAFIRLQKDSVLWVSISATFLGIEAFRLYITPHKIAILNKLNKTIEYHPFDYVETISHIPMTFSILQDIIMGNPVYVGDSIVSYRQTENHTMIGTVGAFFKNLLTVSIGDNHLERIKLDDIDLNQNRTASLLYSNYEKNNNLDFSTYREISVSEKSKVDIGITFKQYEFNKELSFPFNVPRNYKTK
ncbi:MAG: DUF4292 domain-containing protein [Ginsengibacter sp.]